MAEGTAFPQFIVLREDPNNQRVYDDFVRKMGDAGKRASGSLGQAMSGVRDTIAEALSIPRNAGGSLDLNIQQLREMERQSEAVARATREYALASKQAAIASGENSRARNQEIRAAFELARAEDASLASLRTKIRVLDQVQAELNQTASATDVVTMANKRGTDAWGIHANSMRGSRQAMVQTGQQLQDVAISLYGGQRASVVFAQQIPQLMFALTSLEGSANKTASRIGSFATLMSGPWSIAVVLFSAVLGGLIDKFLLSGDAASKSGSATSRLADKIDIAKNSYESLIAVVNEYNAAQDLSTSLTGAAIISAQELAAANLKVAESNLARIQSDPNLGLKPGQVGTYGVQLVVAQGNVDRLKKDLAQSDIAASSERAKIATDTRYGIEVAWNKELVKWQEKRRRNEIDAQTLDRVTLRLTQGKLDAIKRFDETHRKTSSSSGSGLYGREIGMADARRIATGAGFQVNSGTRPTWIRDEKPGGGSSQERLYNKWLAEGRPANNPTAKPGTSAHERGNALDIQFAAGVNRESIKKAFADEGVRLTKILKERGHYHIEWSTKGADKALREADVLENKQKAMAEFGERSAEKISRINEAFDEQPRLIDRAAQATRALDETINELKTADPKGENSVFQQLIKDAEAAKSVVEDSLVRPLREMRDESEQRLDVERLITAGLEDEAQALQIIYGLEKNIGPLRVSQKQDILEQVKHEREVTEELRRRQEITNQYLDATRSVKQELASIFSGTGSFKNLGQIFKNLQGQVIVEKLFGNAFRDFDKWVKGESGLSASVDYFTKETTAAGDAVMNFAKAANEAAMQMRSPQMARISGSVSSGASSIAALFDAGAANDNPAGDIVVEARRNENSVMSLTPERYFSELSKTVVGPALDGLDAIFGTKFFGKLSGVFSGAMNGFLTGGATGGILGGLAGIPGLDAILGGRLGKGLKGAQTGTLVSGLAGAFGINLSGGGSQLGGAIGSLIPIPGGDIIGSIAGGIIGKLFGKRPRGAGSVSNSAVNASANDGGITDSLTGTGGDIQSAISRIANALGASVGNYSVGIGRYRDYYQVSSNANDPRLGNSYFGRDSSSALYDGKDAEEAMRAAISAAIAQGAIEGLRGSSQVLLKAGKDIEAQLDKVLKFEDVFKSLRQIKDPVGAALDELNRWAEEMKKIFSEAGASAEEYAQLEELYGIKRAEAIKQATDSVASSLRSLLDELTVGNDALSLRERQSAAVANYDPLRARVAAGDVTAYNDFAEAARALLDIERQMFGSQSGYFNRLGEVTGLTRSALSAQEALAAGSSGAASPFAANDNVVGALGTQTGVLTGGFGALATGIAAVNENLGTLIQIGMSGGIGPARFDGVNVANF